MKSDNNLGNLYDFPQHFFQMSWTVQIEEADVQRRFASLELSTLTPFGSLILKIYEDVNSYDSPLLENENADDCLPNDGRRLEEKHSKSGDIRVYPLASVNNTLLNSTTVKCFPMESKTTTALPVKDCSIDSLDASPNAAFKEFTVQFINPNEASQFSQQVERLRCDNFPSEDAEEVLKRLHDGSMPKNSMTYAVDARHMTNVDASTVQTYFSYYGKLSNQSNMLQDSVRTTTYRRAIVDNPSDFRGKVVMDVGAGSGILSFFAVEAGAVKVYAVEASSSAEVAKRIALSNPSLATVVEVLHCTIESLTLADSHIDGSVKDIDNSRKSNSSEHTGDVVLPENVDVLVSEPIGTFLFNERMIESYLFARDNFLKPGGKMFPDRCRLVVAPFTDAFLYQDMSSRGSFWQNANFHGIDLTSMAGRALDEQFRQPIIDYIDPNIIVSQPCTQEFDLMTIRREDLEYIAMDLEYEISHACLVHGLAGWFDVSFGGSNSQIEFSTSPRSPPTHWYQIRFLFMQPLAVNPGQSITGRLEMLPNRQQSYNVQIAMNIKGTDIYTRTTTIDLKDPDYRYYTNPSGSYYPTTQSTQTIQVTPDVNHSTPSTGAKRLDAYL